MLGTDEDALDAELAALGREFPELGAERLAPGEPHALEPVSPPTSRACGWRRATRCRPPRRRWPSRGVRRPPGARMQVGSPATPADVRADVVVVAAGPWTPALVDPTGRWRPITALWGVNVELHLPEPPRHALEEAGIDALLAAGGGEDGLFALVTAGRVSSLGATFLPDEPDAAARAPRLQERGARFVPALAATPIVSVRACARPRSADGRPLLGRRGDLVVASGHGAVGHLARAGVRAARGRPRAGARAGDPAGARRRALRRLGAETDHLGRGHRPSGIRLEDE